MFYVTGGSSLVWVVFWFYLVYDTPAQHPRIDKEEQKYIESSIGEKYLDRKNLVTPWRSIFTSVPVWGIVLGHAASNWGNYTLNQQVSFKRTSSYSHQSLLASNLPLQCFALQPYIQWTLGFHVLPSPVGCMCCWLLGYRPHQVQRDNVHPSYQEAEHIPGALGDRCLRGAGNLCWLPC